MCTNLGYFNLYVYVIYRNMEIYHMNVAEITRINILINIFYNPTDCIKLYECIRNILIQSFSLYISMH
jgi:hypothetical protein